MPADLCRGRLRRGRARDPSVAGTVRGSPDSRDLVPRLRIQRSHKHVFSPGKLHAGVAGCNRRSDALQPGDRERGVDAIPPASCPSRSRRGPARPGRAVCRRVLQCDRPGGGGHCHRRRDELRAAAGDLRSSRAGLVPAFAAGLCRAAQRFPVGGGAAGELDWTAAKPAELLLADAVLALEFPAWGSPLRPHPRRQPGEWLRLDRERLYLAALGRGHPALRRFRLLRRGDGEAGLGRRPQEPRRRRRGRNRKLCRDHRDRCPDGVRLASHLSGLGGPDVRPHCPGNTARQACGDSARTNYCRSGGRGGLSVMNDEWTREISEARKGIVRRELRAGNGVPSPSRFTLAGLGPWPRVILKHWSWIVLMTVVVTAAATALAETQPRVYRAQAEVAVYPASSGSSALQPYVMGTDRKS